MNHHEQLSYASPATQDDEQGVLSRALNRVGNLLKNNKNRLTASATSVVLAVTLAGCGVSAQEEGPKPSTTTSAPSPEASETPDVADYKVPVEYTDEQLIALEDEPLPADLEPYAAMSVIEFEKLPIEERLTYCSYLNRDQDYIENEFYKGYNNDTTYLLPDSFTEDSSAQEIISASGIYTKAAFVTHFGGAVYDRDTQQKLLSCAWINPSSENPSSTYSFWTNARNESTVTGTPALIAKDGKLQYNTAQGERPSTTATTADGKEYFARTISSVDNEGNQFESTYLLVDYTDYKGVEKSVYVNYDEVVES